MFRKNVGSQFIHVQGVDSTTGGIKSGVTWTVRRCLDGTFAAATGTATEDGTTGWYKFALSQADTNGNNCGFNFTGTGAVPQTVNIITDGSPPGVMLADGVAHGGTLGSSTATLALSRANLTSQTLNTNGLQIVGNGTGHGISSSSGAGATGNGMHIIAASTNGTGLNVLGTGSGEGFTATGGATGNGIQAEGGATSGAGIRVLAGATTGNGMNITGTGSSEGMRIAGGATGTGMALIGGATSGVALTATATSGNAITATGGGTGNGATFTSGSGATGDGVQMIAASTNGDGLQLTKTGTGSDLNATVTPLVLAKTTNITGFNDVAATDIVSAGAITTLSGAVVNVDLVDLATTTTTATNVTTVNGLAANVITAAATAADFGTEVAAAVWDMDATAHQTQGTFGQAIGDPVADTGTIFKATVTDATGVTVGTDTATLLTRMGTPSDLGGGATLAFNLSDIEAQTDDIGAAGAGLTAADDAILAILGTPAGVSLAADIAAIEAQTDDIGVAGAGLTAVPWNAAWDAEVESEVNDALVVHRLDELLNADSDIDGVAPPTVGSVFHELLTKAAAGFTYDQTTDSLEAVRDRGDAAWITATGFATSGQATAIQADTDDIQVQIGVAGAGLTAINLPDQTMNITGNITGNLSGSVGSVTGAVGSVTGNVGGNVVGTVASVVGAVGSVAANGISAASLAADAGTEIATAVGALTLTELAAIPGASPALKDALALLYMALRNRRDTTATQDKIANDAGTAIATATLSDDATTFTKGEYA